MQSESDINCQRVHYPLVRYYRDCLAVQVEWARAVNVLEQKDVFLVPLSAEEQWQLGVESSLGLSRPAALELAKRHAAGGSEVSLMLGALFLVGCAPATATKPERRFCAPLLEVSLTLRRDLADGLVRVEPEEDEFSINYSLIGELLGADENDLQDRLAELAELVPDFPIDAEEFDNFWNGFRMVATELTLSDAPPPATTPTGKRPDKRSPDKRTEETPAVVPPRPGDTPSSEPLSEPLSDRESQRLQIIDFYLPQIPKDGRFYLLPATAIVLGSRAGHSLSALRELDSMANLPLDKTAFGCLVDSDTAVPASVEPSSDVILEDALPLSLTRTQEAIVRCARTAPLTVVTGPPGTGKSYTITAMVLDALLRGQSVLVASQMDKAVQVVADQVEAIAGQNSIARSGGRAAQRRLAKQISKVTGPRRRLTAPSSSESRQVRSQFRELAKSVGSLERRYEDIVQQEHIWSESWQSFQRLQQTCALPVQDISARHLRKARRLATRAQAALTGTPGWLRRRWGTWQQARALRLLQVPTDWECSLEDLDELVGVQIRWREFRDAELKLRSPFPANVLWQELVRLQQRLSECALQLLTMARQRSLSRILGNQNYRAQLRHLPTLLRRRRHDLKYALRAQIDPTVMLTAFPAWASTLRTLGEILPATPAMFDLTIIDEASQCDPAFAAVALLRGKRAVVVGDPQQLRHVCFLSRAREQAAFASCGLTAEMQQQFRYRRSLFDIAADTVDQEHFFMLDQHFRSHPHIIDFSNQKFYEGNLRIMTRRPSHAPQSAIRVVQAAGRRAAGSSVNQREVDVVTEIVTEIVEGNRELPVAPSIGIVSPFRDHVDAVFERIIAAFPASVIQRHGIVVGTAHALQGDEKDIVVFTTSIDVHSHPASLRFLETPNLFNVAITRARRQLIVVTSVGVDDLPSGLLRDFLHHAAGHWHPQQDVGEREHESFRGSVIERLRQQPVDVWPGFHAAGLRIDAVVAHGDRYVAVLCDGYPFANNEAGDNVTTHRILNRAGWPVVRISHRSWQADWFACVEAVMNRVQA